MTQAPGDDATRVRYLVWRDPRTMTDAEFDAQREAERLGEPQPWPFSEEMLSHRSAAEREAYLARLRALPRRVLPMIVSALPDRLASAPPDAEIRVFDGRCDRIERAEVLRHTLAARIRAQARGHLSLREAAAVLAAPHGRTVEDLADDLIEAASKGKLTAWRSPHAKIKRKTETPEGIRELEAFGAIFTRPEDVDAWLAKIDPERRLPRFPEGPWTANRLPTQQPHEGREAAPTAAPAVESGANAADSAPAANALGREPLKPFPQQQVREKVTVFRVRCIRWALDEIRSSPPEPGSQLLEKGRTKQLLQKINAIEFKDKNFAHAWDAFLEEERSAAPR